MNAGPWNDKNRFLNGTLYSVLANFTSRGSGTHPAAFVSQREHQGTELGYRTKVPAATLAAPGHQGHQRTTLGSSTEAPL